MKNAFCFVLLLGNYGFNGIFKIYVKSIEQNNAFLCEPWLCGFKIKGKPKMCKIIPGNRTIVQPVVTSSIQQQGKSTKGYQHDKMLICLDNHMKFKKEMIKYIWNNSKATSKWKQANAYDKVIVGTDSRSQWLICLASGTT